MALPAVAPIDTSSRAAVTDLYNTVYLPALSVVPGWTGSVAGCMAGTVSEAYANATLDAVNVFRALAQLPATIPRNPVKDAKSQQAALMMTANNNLDHFPPPSWTCYTDDGAEAAGKANLALGTSGARAVAAYMRDAGAGNTAVGHRRWILFPRQTEMGAGSTNNADALWVIGEFGARPLSPQLVTWPSAGYVPFALVYPRWSFSVNTASDVNLTGATVSMTQNGMPITVVPLSQATGFGDNTLVWEPSTQPFTAGMTDQVIEVSVQNVLVAGVAQNFSYTTHSGFQLFYLLQNPHDVAVTVDVEFLRPPPLAPVLKSYVVGPTSRANVWVNTEPELASTDVSATITSSRPIVVERAMYLNRPGLPFAAGHESAGISAPATSWFLAEGATGPYFDLFLLIANPNDTAAMIEARFLLPDGTVIVKDYVVAGKSRFNIWVDEEGGLLADTAVSTTLTSTNGVPVLVERAMWWPGSAATWHEAHNSAGATTAGTRWALAEGEVGGVDNLETYVLIANTSAADGRARVSLLFEDGSSSGLEVMLKSNSRTNVAVGVDFPESIGKRFGTLVESLGDMPVEIVVERAMYADSQGMQWAAGTNALATRLP